MFVLIAVELYSLAPLSSYIQEKILYSHAYKQFETRKGPSWLEVTYCAWMSNFMDAFTNGIPGILINNTKLMISLPPPLHQLFAQIDWYHNVMFLENTYMYTRKLNIHQE